MSRPSTCASTCTARSSWLRSIAIGPAARRTLLYAPSNTGLPVGRDVHGQRLQIARIGDGLRIVGRDDVVGLAVVGIDPDARGVDVAERRLERGLPDVARGDADHAGLGALDVHAQLRIVELQRDAQVAHAVHGACDLRDRLGLLVQLIEVVTADLDDERRGVAVEEDAGDEAARRL